MILKCLGRMVIAGLIAGAGVALNMGSVNAVGVIVMGFGAIWFIGEMFLLSLLLLVTGLNGLMGNDTPDHW